MQYLSVCSGIDAPSVAWMDLDWNPIAFSEIEPFPSAVLKTRFPNVKNMGDMQKFKEWDFGRSPVDLLVGGTPPEEKHPTPPAPPPKLTAKYDDSYIYRTFANPVAIDLGPVSVEKITINQSIPERNELIAIPEGAIIRLDSKRILKIHSWCPLVKVGHPTLVTITGFIENCPE